MAQAAQALLRPSAGRRTVLRRRRLAPQPGRALAAPDAAARGVAARAGEGAAARGDAGAAGRHPRVRHVLAAA
eukprot:scaffold104137_cov87-Phaeocystis_antarctica.AAC.6